MTEATPYKPRKVSNLEVRMEIIGLVGEAISRNA